MSSKVRGLKHRKAIWFSSTMSTNQTTFAELRSSLAGNRSLALPSARHGRLALVDPPPAFPPRPGAPCSVPSPRALQRAGSLASRSAMMASRARPLALTRGRFPPATRQASLRRISPRSRHDPHAQPPPFAPPELTGALMATPTARARPALAAPFASPSDLFPLPSLVPQPFLLLRARALRLQPPAARTELERWSKFVPVPPPFPNSPHTELDHFLSFLFPHFSRAPLNSPARNRDFPRNPHFRPPEQLHHPNVFVKSHWWSRAPPTPVKATDLAGVEAAAAAPPLLRRRRPPSLLRPLNRHHSTRGELLVLFPHLSDLLPPSFGRRNAADEPRAYLHLLPFHRVPSERKGALADGTYNLVPINEEEVPEGGANVVVIDPEPDSQLAQEGKPRSMT
nr:unnamed protein product [Digitaria exilis]